MLPLTTSTRSPAIAITYFGCKQIRRATKLEACFRSKVWRESQQGKKLLLVSCSSYGDGELGEKQEGESGWSLEGQVDKLLGDEALMQDLNAAVERVAKARRDLEALEEQGKQTSLSENLDAVTSLVEACQRDVFAAELDLKNAEISLVKARAGMVNDLGAETFDKDAERVESGKVAGVSGIMGFLAGLPFFSLAEDLDGLEMAVSAGIVVVSCAVFGLTYRYAVRRDLSNTQLRAGCIAAFALVRCLAQVDAIRLFADLPHHDLAQQLLQGGLFAAESVAVFGFAAVGLEYCFQRGIVSPFPLKQP